MEPITPEWATRVERLWERFDEFDEQAFVAAVDELAAELPDDSTVAAFERAGARDSTGRTAEAIPLYRAALATGPDAAALDPSRRRQATIQLASSLRALGHAEESVELLAAESRQPSDELDDAVTGFLALALADAGREREALAVALTALSGHLTRYRRSLTAYASELA
ncbi:tetratricopeptide repeat protein [Herbiconiux ginsengi]|uniref:Tetratrico peptide repeat-containing protein n=1 Tax=Herbiconiux ginsengi TaxID=381665 RepID=A0A1H3LEV2_9MICO|nr:tetratricopeptide repeat protein [Herbiconiux ginsengi]SDY62488.1 Tetratrico peptide repeat-containing protein [Herbiconiux ginsengi]